MKKTLFLAVLCTLAIMTAATTASAKDADFMQGLGDVRYHLSNAEQLGRDFHIYVMLPDGYDAFSRDYPTVYLLDGGNLFPMLVPYYRYIRFAEEVPDAIIIGISYGSDNFETGNFRSTDYTAPTTEREHWGGAQQFQAYLAETLLPFIEDNYRSDTRRRVVFGQSLGGQFAIYSAMTQPGLFWGHIASNAALHRNLSFFLQEQSAHDGEQKRPKLFIATADQDDPRFLTPRNEWIRYWSAVENKPWHLKVVELKGHSHMSAPPAGFRQGMRWLFGND